MNSKTTKNIRLSLYIALGVFMLASAASAGQILLNGSFESGLTSWTVTNSTTDGSGWFVTNVNNTPLNGFPTVGPSAGSYYAVADSYGLSSPESFALTQTFTDPVGTTSAILSFDIFVNDVFGSGGTPQFGEVDLLAGGANRLTGTPIHVFYNADTFQADPGAPNPYVHVSLDISSYMTPGQSYQIRALQSDSGGPLDVGVDNFSLVTNGGGAVPEPNMFFPLVLVAGIFVYKSRRKVRA